MTPGYSVNHALMTCSISTRPLGEPASGRVKSLICMGMAECSSCSVMHPRQRGGVNLCSDHLMIPAGTEAGAQPGGNPLLAVCAPASPVKPPDDPLEGRR